MIKQIRKTIYIDTILLPINQMTYLTIFLTYLSSYYCNLPNSNNLTTQNKKNYSVDKNNSNRNFISPENLNNILLKDIENITNPIIYHENNLENKIYMYISQILESLKKLKKSKQLSYFEKEIKINQQQIQFLEKEKGKNRDYNKCNGEIDKKICYLNQKIDWFQNNLNTFHVFENLVIKESSNIKKYFINHLNQISACNESIKTMLHHLNEWKKFFEKNKPRLNTLNISSEKNEIQKLNKIKEENYISEYSSLQNMKNFTSCNSNSSNNACSSIENKKEQEDGWIIIDDYTQTRKYNTKNAINKKIKDTELEIINYSGICPKNFQTEKKYLNGIESQDDYLNDFEIIENCDKFQSEYSMMKKEKPENFEIINWDDADVNESYEKKKN